MQSHLMTKQGDALCKKVPSWAYMVTLRSLVTCKLCLKILDKDKMPVPTPETVDPIEINPGLIGGMVIPERPKLFADGGPYETWESGAVETYFTLLETKLTEAIAQRDAALNALAEEKVITFGLGCKLLDLRERILPPYENGATIRTWRRDE